MEIIITEEEVALLQHDLFEKYGYDFRNYSLASLQRRIQRLVALDRFRSFAEFRYVLQNDPYYLKRFVEEVTVNVTEMFRDPPFYQFLRTQVLPALSGLPLIRVWHAGCATGEEVFSLAILLKEAGLLHKSLLYATDLNPAVVQKAMTGVFPLQQMRLYSANYLRAGGRQDFSAYYSAKYNVAKFDESLRHKMIFATHNLVSDRSFHEFQLILCRNVLIYFDQQLQAKVLDTFDRSLEVLGFLALGARETLRFSSLASRYKEFSSGQKIWRKIS
ncbi:protein-glutamate O-methyltransferase CheR [Paraflavisolibacter sp. H34]|uniref:CheR family methyltransferase n=1 Tax=Huijunlia imazamoxiresistens TaxID=3127457 RepID=UPI0030184031